MANADTPQRDKPHPHKTMVLVTDDEWRALRVAAAGSDTSVQGYLTQLVLRDLQSRSDDGSGTARPAAG